MFISVLVGTLLFVFFLIQADVFSYGIILAEVISRIPADPDFMPRTQVHCIRDNVSEFNPSFLHLFLAIWCQF